MRNKYKQIYKSKIAKIALKCSLLISLIGIIPTTLISCSKSSDDSYTIKIPDNLNKHQSVSMHLYYCSNDIFNPELNINFNKGFSWNFIYDDENNNPIVSDLYNAPANQRSIKIPQNAIEVSVVFLDILNTNISIYIPQKLNVCYGYYFQGGDDLFENEKGEIIDFPTYPCAIYLYTYIFNDTGVEIADINKSLISVKKY